MKEMRKIVSESNHFLELSVARKALAKMKHLPSVVFLLLFLIYTLSSFPFPPPNK